MLIILRVHHILPQSVALDVINNLIPFLFRCGKYVLSIRTSFFIVNYNFLLLCIITFIFSNQTLLWETHTCGLILVIINSVSFLDVTLLDYCNSKHMWSAS